MTWLTTEIGAYHDGAPCPGALVAALREAELLVPLVDGDLPMCVAADGLVWICAFTSARTLARFADARSAGAGFADAGGTGEAERPYRCVRGAELLELDHGVAVDLGARRPMLFPAGCAS